MKNDDIYFMKLAFLEAKKAYLLNEVPVGAVVVKDGVVIGRGYNCKELYNDPLMHAEIIAIREACGYLCSWRLDGCILYTTMKPCLMCIGTALESRILHIVYLIENTGNMAEFKNSNKLIDLQLESDYLDLIKNFFRMLRK